jgi:hypothetical protein
MTNRGSNSLVGHVNEFKLKEDDFSGWTERFELFIQLNEINSHKKKLLLFITLIGNEGYSLLRDLCLPIKPLDKSYDDLKTLLSEHMNPKSNVVTERFQFKERRQGSETIMQLIAILKKMSEFCEFGTHLDDVLRDQLVWGIKDKTIQKRLLSEESLNFKKICGIEQSHSKGLVRLAHARGATKKRAQKIEFKYLYTYVFINNIGMYIIHFIYNIHKIVFNL